uniref:ATP synthase subunit a n=1 Tax=Pealius mori TaxID=1453199 RepID=A0A7G2CVX9_9HEMI|nr:ATP synthase F0 subunit 6 [Pealius mori]WPM91811.1 ATP synthase F0 subunit 6 [Pealius mori]CAD5105728.1 ATP synthase F0 subunit 6 [Pealius mori]
MMSSLFEVYDPYTFFLGLSLNWLVLFFCVFCLFGSYWLLNSAYVFSLKSIFNFFMTEFKMFLKLKLAKGLIFIFVVLLFYFSLVNLFGLVPYVFSVSSHFVFCLSFSFPFWLGLMVMGWLNLTNQMFSHLIPMGTPLALISFMVLIETVSQLIRPWSLAIRLMANMISGHLLMSLLGGIKFLKILAIFVQWGLFFFEFFVCFIQAYVFCALMALYYGEV